MTPSVIAMAIVLFAQNPSIRPAPSAAPLDAKANVPDVIAENLTGEADACARRALIVSRYAEELAQRTFDNPTPAQIDGFRAFASEMYQSSHDMNAPQGSPPPDFATLCASASDPTSTAGPAPTE